MQSTCPSHRRRPPSADSGTLLRRDLLRGHRARWLAPLLPAVAGLLLAVGISAGGSAALAPASTHAQARSGAESANCCAHRADEHRLGLRLSAPALPTDPQYAVGLRTIRIVEHRTLRIGRRRVPRTLFTLVRYPAAGRDTGTDQVRAAPLGGRFPLIVFAPGFDVTPVPYAALLHAWAAAGYVVAAPAFPLTKPGAPGGPDERDIVNQPGDMTAVITRLIGSSQAATNPLRGLVDATEVGVAGQSDGGETALAIAYDGYYIDHRVRAAAILSGARLPIPGFSFAPGSPPLLASQGTADTTNLPHNTYEFFKAAAAPKYLLALLGAGHLPPYTTEQPQLGIVEGATTAFFDSYLKHVPGAIARLRRAGTVPGEAALTADR